MLFVFPRLNTMTLYSISPEKAQSPPEMSVPHEYASTHQFVRNMVNGVQMSVLGYVQTKKLIQNTILEQHAPVAFEMFNSGMYRLIGKSPVLLYVPNAELYKITSFLSRTHSDPALQTNNLPKFYQACHNYVMFQYSYDRLVPPDFQLALYKFFKIRDIYELPDMGNLKPKSGVLYFTDLRHEKNTSFRVGELFQSVRGKPNCDPLSMAQLLFTHPKLLLPHNARILRVEGDQFFDNPNYIVLRTALNISCPSRGIKVHLLEQTNVNETSPQETKRSGEVSVGENKRSKPDSQE
jgi:hypothetical protein